MKSLRITTTLVLGLFSFSTIQATGDPKPIQLFNGKDLSGWTRWLRASQHKDPHEVFTVENDSIRISGEGFGYLGTKAEFENYRLTLEFRWGKQTHTDRGARKGTALDSGVFLHATGPHGNSHDGDGAYMAAIECNIYQGATGDFLLIRGDDHEGNLIVPQATVSHASFIDSEGFPFWKPGGPKRELHTFGRINWRKKSLKWKDKRDFRGSNDLEKAYGAWNRLVCECRDRSISTWLNGTLINQISDIFPFKGKILLQSEGAEIYYRNITLTPLASKKTPK